MFTRKSNLAVVLAVALPLLASTSVMAQQIKRNTTKRSNTIVKPIQNPTCKSTTISPCATTLRR